MKLSVIFANKQRKNQLRLFFIHLNKDVLETHSIIKLLEDVNSDEQRIHISKRDAAMLTRFAIRTRYAERRIDIAKEDAEFALRRAKQTIDQAEQLLAINNTAKNKTD